MMARSFNAFYSVNFPVLARIQDEHIIRYLPYDPIREPLRFQREVSDSICVMKLIPGSRPELLAYLFEHYDCIVIESFGVGGIPAKMLEQFYAEMEKWASKGKFTSGPSRWSTKAPTWRSIRWDAVRRSSSCWNPTT